MRPTVVIREFDRLTGKIKKLHDPNGFGEILSGDTCDVAVIDFVISGVKSITEVTLSLSVSEGIEVSPPDATIVDNISEEGNFGIEQSASFAVKNSLSSYFADVNLPISISMRSDNETNFIYLNLSPGTYEKINGIIKYKINFKYINLMI